MKQIDVVGLGNAIVDVLAQVDDEYLESLGVTKGAMTLVDAGRAETLYDRMEPTAQCSGGSAANTIAGLASLGGDGAYIGKVRDDGLGRIFERDIRAQGVVFETAAAASGPSTARCLIFVTPDAQRTMQTFLGASATLGPDDVDAEMIRRAKITYLEGYLWDPAPAKEAFRKAAGIAHEAGRRVALTLSDSFCVERHRAEFRELAANDVDILFSNEDEILSLYEVSDLQQALGELRGSCEIAVVTRGANGSVILAGDSTYEVPAEPLEKVVDTTGAGDLYASGFLHGLSQGRDLAVCGRIGSIAAAEIVSRVGARPQVSLSDLVKEKLG